MLVFPTFGDDWLQIFGAIWFALVIGKLTRQQTTVLSCALIGAILTESWVGVFVPPLLIFSLYPLDVIRKVGG